MKVFFIIIGLVLVIAGILILIDEIRNYTSEGDKYGFKMRLILDALIAIMIGGIMLYQII